MDPETRSTGAKRILAKWLYNTTYFSRFALSVSVQIAEHIQHKRVEKGDIVIKKGDVATSMFIIFKGSVGVYLDKDSEKPVALLGDKI